MMGGSSSGPISMRANRSESMEQEADAAKERDYRRGVERARWERNETAKAVHGSRQTTGYDVPVGGAGKPAGYWRDGRSGGYVFEKGSPPEKSETPAQASTPEELALIAARKKKGQEGVQFSRRRAALERSVSKSTGGGQMNWRMPSKENPVGELAELRDSRRDIWFGREKF